ncbi:hypothetical protein [Evansella clarkii]|uniref:hypothetical protein n=1 Tax=Evansella clarkii TaxID=79879 RepID=UPI00099606B8|nr:hypothetical protein [Evansella clarkii]
MAHENKNTRKTLLRHLIVGVFSAFLVYLFYLSYSAWGVQPALWPDWRADHPFWRAWAHAAFVLLFLALILSPMAILWESVKRFRSWRRELGIWFAVLSFGHGYAIWDRWARWDIATLFGFEYFEEAGSYVLLRPEVGIMNMMGLVMAPMITLLAVTSFDRAVKILGPSSWKWLHGTLIHVIFYIVMLRGVLYLFYFFQVTPPDWRVYPPIWFLFVFLWMGIIVVLLQSAAFAKIVLRRINRKQKAGILKNSAVVITAIMYIMPMVLLTGIVAYFDSRALKEPPFAAEQEHVVPEDSAESFEMILHSDGRDIYFWADNLDSEPYFRQMMEMDGETILDEIYRYSERTLYVGELDDNSEIVWSAIENIAPEDIGILEISNGPGVWAAQYGPGEHQIQLPEGELQVTIISEGEAISEKVFEIPPEAELDSGGR